MKAKNIGFLVTGVLLAIACGDTQREAPPIRCDANACPSGGSAGVGGSGAASGQGGSGGRGGAGGSSGAAGTGTSGSGGTTSTDAGGRAGSSSVGRGGSAGRDAAPDVDASRGDASDAAADATGRRCLEPTRVQDGGSCTLAICRRGTTVEISVSRPEGWYVGALFWVLTVCDISYIPSRSPGGDTRTQIYDIPEADWARLREGDPVFMHYGTPGASSAGVQCGQLTKTIQNCAP